MSLSASLDRKEIFFSEHMLIIGGSTKAVRNWTGIFEQLLNALVLMGEHLELSGFRLDLKTFSDSPDYARSLIEFYKTFIAFWSSALKFSKRNKAANMARTIWDGYKFVLQELESRMRRHSEAIRDCAAAVDRKRQHNERANAEADRAGTSNIL